jgi:hypothetical protein
MGLTASWFRHLHFQSYRGDKYSLTSTCTPASTACLARLISSAEILLLINSSPQLLQISAGTFLKTRVALLAPKITIAKPFSIFPYLQMGHFMYFPRKVLFQNKKVGIFSPAINHPLGRAHRELFSLLLRQRVELMLCSRCNLINKNT